MSSAMVVLLSGCSGLSKGDAREALAKRFSESPTAYCKLRDSVSEEKPGLYAASGTAKPCLDQLKKVGALVAGGCATTYSSGECMYEGFKEGPKGLIKKGRWVYIACGTRTFGDVTSISTEGKTAKVKFTRTFKLDDTKSELSECVLDPISDGEGEGTTTFKQDDGGNWSEG
jgi:hypothetical protein